MRSYHYRSDALPVAAITCSDGNTWAIRRTDGQYVVWQGETEAGMVVPGPIVFRSAEAGQRFLSDLADLTPDGTYRVVCVTLASVLYGASGVLPVVWWTRLDTPDGPRSHQYGAVPISDVLAALARSIRSTTENDQR